MPTNQARLAGLTARLFRPVDIASLATFRIMFGLVMLWEVWRYADKGWIGRFYLEPDFLFTYYGFGWLQPWPGDGMYWHFGLLGLLALLIAIGLCYRMASILFFLAFTYLTLLDQARYLNHFYLASLIALLMCFVPASRAWSVDAIIRGKSEPRVPAWTLWLLLIQFEIMYLFAGLVKINADWLRLEPLRTWLQSRDDTVLVGQLFQYDWVIATAAYGSIALHIIGAPLLLWKKTRIYVFVLYALFHLANHVLFDIGIFPWVALAGTLLFFDPDWPRQVWRRVKSFVRPHDVHVATSPPVANALPPPLTRHAVLALMLGWSVFQIAMPLRHHLYPGNVSWHEQGHRYAWQMKLRQKRGEATFEITDPATGRVWSVDPDDYLTRRQLRYMSGRPDMILQFAHHLEDVWLHRHGVAEPEIRATVLASLNGREPSPLIDPTRDLTQVRRSLAPADWILPLPVPLPAHASAVADRDP